MAMQRTETYSKEQDIKNTTKMREVLETLPRFCRRYFRGIEETTSARTRLGYAYDLRIFFEFLSASNPSLKDREIPSYDIEVLRSIGKEDVEEYLEYLSYYKKDGKVYTNDERGKARKLSALRSMFRYFYRSEVLDRDVTALVPLPKRHEKPIIRLDEGEVGTLLEQVDDGAKLTKRQLAFHKRTRVRDVAMLTLLLGTGIRVSECVGLDLQDINFRILVYTRALPVLFIFIKEIVAEAVKRRPLYSCTVQEDDPFLPGLIAVFIRVNIDQCPVKIKDIIVEFK